MKKVLIPASVHNMVKITSNAERTKNLGCSFSKKIKAKDIRSLQLTETGLIDFVLNNSAMAYYESKEDLENNTPYGYSIDIQLGDNIFTLSGEVFDNDDAGYVDWKFIKGTNSNKLLLSIEQLIRDYEIEFITN